MNDLIVRFDPYLNIVYVNNVFCECAGINEQQLLKMNLNSLFEYGFIDDSDLATIKERISKILASHNSSSNTYKLFLPDKGLRWIHWVARGIFDETGNIKEIQIVGRDITELRKLSNIKDNFVAMVNHDIKTVLVLFWAHRKYF